MAGVITYANIKIINILEPISKTRDKEFSVQNFIGTTGGNSVEHIRTSGLVVSFQSIVGPDSIRSSDGLNWLVKYRNLAKYHEKNPGVLTSTGDLEINGNYYLTNYHEEKKINGSYILTWEFKEYVKPNIVKATFKRIGKSATKKTTKAKKTTAKKTSSYITILLSDCGALKYGMTNKKCVKYLQKFLQKKGYYKGYKIDGDYLKYTKQEVNKLQKAYKIKVSKQNQGQWDKVTRDYWRKKYNITSKKKK